MLVQARAEALPQWKQEVGKRILLRTVTEAYGRMLLGPGLFQADCHPGNILVSDTGAVGEASSPSMLSGAFSLDCTSSFAVSLVLGRCSHAVQYPLMALKIWPTPLLPTSLIWPRTLPLN